jgi:nucleoside-diphosphate-sugar epimerase
VPGRAAQAVARAVAALPLLPQVAGWAEALSRPVVMDTSKAKRELGWRPRFTGLEALRATVRIGQS